MENNNSLLLFGGAAAVALLVFGGKKAADATLNTIVHYSLNNDQVNKIMKLNVAAQPTFYNFTRDVQENLGWNALYNNTYRTIPEQTILYNKNHSNAKPGYSMHNFGMAADINFQKGSVVLHKSDSDKKWKDSGIVAVAKKWGLFWGGDLSNYQDAVHFDMRNKYSIELLRRKAIEQYGSIEAAEGNKVRV